MKNLSSEQSGNAAKTQAPAPSKALALPGIAPLPMLNCCLLVLVKGLSRSCSYMGPLLVQVLNNQMRREGHKIW